ncbi:hypothetical protein [Pedobacter sp. NJ-S-72]
MKKRILYLFILQFSIIAGCKKQETITSSDEKRTKSVNAFSANGMAVNDGRLTFATQEAFEALMNKGLADTLGTAIVQEIAQSVRSNFVSYAKWRENVMATPVMMKSAQTNSVGEQNEVDLDSLIEDPLFAQ